MPIIKKYRSKSLWFTALLLSALVAGCSSDNDSSTDTVNPAALSVISTSPVNSTVSVETNRKVTATFSESMTSASLDTVSFTVKGANETAMVGDVSLDAASNTAVFAPGSNLTPGTVYTATITTAAESTTGKTMATNHAWSFTSGTSEDNTNPTVSSTDPADTANDFYLNRNITASFSEPLDPASVNTNTFTLTNTDTSTNVAGVVIYNDNGHAASFNPDNNLIAGTNYTATLTTGIQDLAGNTLSANYPINFSGSEASPAIGEVELGTAGNFAILAKTAISKTGTAGTMVTGDIGVSPSALSDITGFSVVLNGTYATSDFVTGNVYAADMTAPTPDEMTTAVSDMELAYTNAAGRTLPDFTELGAGNVSGMTLTPGLYKWGTNVLITSAGVTISGSETDVWIFQIAQDLVVDNAAIVTLAGGARPENIFWQVAGGTGVSIGTTAEFKGIVLAQKAIIVNTGASVNGRLLAQSAVTLDGNAITEPVE